MLLFQVSDMLTIGEMRKMMAYEDLPLFAISQTSDLLREIGRSDCAPPGGVPLHAQLQVNGRCTHAMSASHRLAGTCYVVPLPCLLWVDLVCVRMMEACLERCCDRANSASLACVAQPKQRR